MAKKLSLSGANAVRTILKNKEEFHTDLLSKEEDGGRTTYTYDFFYGDTNGTFTVVTENDAVVIAVLKPAMGRVISLMNDTNIRKLAEYVLEH